jgi:hypothetical protein
LTIPAIKIGPRRPAHQRAQRGNRYRSHGQGCANLRADGA